MDKADFIKSGYKEYPVGILERQWADAFVQKKFVGDENTSYFIDVFFPLGYLPLNKNPMSRSQFEVPEGTLDMELFDFDSIEQMEKFYAKAFVVLSGKY